MKNYRLPKDIVKTSNQTELFTIHRAIIQELSLDDVNHAHADEENRATTAPFEGEQLKHELFIQYQKRRDDWQETYPALLKRLREDLRDLNDIEVIQQAMTAGYQALLKKMLDEAMSLLGPHPVPMAGLVLDPIVEEKYCLIPMWNICGYLKTPR